MSLTREAIIDHLHQILPAAQVVTDHETMQRSSIDNFRKLQNIFGVYTMLLPAAVVYVRSTAEASQVLAFADANASCQLSSARMPSTL